MKITFDANTIRKVISPERYEGDEDHAAAQKVHHSILSGEISPFASATIFSLEAIAKKDRAAFVKNAKGKTSSKESEHGDEIHLSFSIGPDHSLHPGMPAVLVDYLEQAKSLGFRLIHLPRIAMPVADQVRYDLKPELYYKPIDATEALNLSSEVSRELEKRGVGYAKVTTLLDRIASRIGRAVQPRDFLLEDTVFNDDERKEFANAVAEWSDGDSVAAHIGNMMDIFCTNDKAGKGRPSVFNEANKLWLADTYGLRVHSLKEFAGLL